MAMGIQQILVHSIKGISILGGLTFLAAPQYHSIDSDQTDCDNESGASCTWSTQGSSLI